MKIKEKCPKNYNNASFMHYAGILSSKGFLKKTKFDKPKQLYDLMTIPKGQCNQTSNDNKLHNFFLQFSKLKQAFINNCICNASTCILDIKL